MAGTMSGIDVAAVLAIMGFGSFVYAVSGFGFALVSAPLLALVLAPSRAVVLVSLASVASNIRFGALGFRDADRALVLRLVVASLVGMPIGLVVIEHASARGLRLVIGIAVAAIAAVMASGYRPRRAGMGTDVVAGFVSGVLNTSTGTNGPPLVIGLHARGIPPTRFRSTLAAVFFVTNVVAIALFATRGRVLGRDVALAVAVLPLQLAAWAIGSAVHRRLSAERFEKVTIVLLFASALAAIVGALRA